MPLLIPGNYCSLRHCFRNTAKELDKTTNLGISHQTAWNVTQKFGEKLEAEEAALVREYDKDAIEGKKEVPVLFEETDGIYIHLQGKDRPKGKKGREIKVSTAYEGWDENGALVWVGVRRDPTGCVS